mgnify:CR=1 FL=1
MTAQEILTIAAIFLGPIFAVLMTMKIDGFRAARARKLDIYRTLMRLRGLPFHVESVSALNLIEVEFAENEKVIAAWKAYFASLSPTPNADEQLVEETQKKRASLLARLISEISKSLGIKVEQLDIYEGNYVPQGWIDDDAQLRVLRQGVINVVHGRAPIVVQPANPHPRATSTPFPPPPTLDDK